MVFFDSGLQFPETLRYLDGLAEQWRLNYHVLTADPDLLTVLIAGGGFDHDAVDRRLRGPLADIMITGPANQAHHRYGRGSLWGVRSEESTDGGCCTGAAWRRKPVRSRIAHAWRHGPSPVV